MGNSCRTTVSKKRGRGNGNLTGFCFHDSVIAPEMAMLAGPKPKPTRSTISEVTAMVLELGRREEGGLVGTRSGKAPGLL